jgi:hypothetical protein
MERPGGGRRVGGGRPRVLPDGGLAAHSSSLICRKVPCDYDALPGRPIIAEHPEREYVNAVTQSIDRGPAQVSNLRRLSGLHCSVA